MVEARKEEVVENLEVVTGAGAMVAATAAAKIAPVPRQSPGSKEGSDAVAARQLFVPGFPSPC